MRLFLSERQSMLIILVIYCVHMSCMSAIDAIESIDAIERSVCDRCECALLARSKDALYVNCSAQHFSSLPKHLPQNTKMVHLENNSIKNMSLSLEAFNYWRNVTYLNLNNNTVESFVGLEGTKVLKNLVALNMALNRLREIPPFILDQLSHLDELYLSENPWHCDCKTVVFQTWIQKHYKIVKDVDNIRCGDTTDHKVMPRNGVHSGYARNMFSNRILFRISKSELCPQPNEPFEMLDILNIVLSALIIIIILKLLYDYWWQRRTGKLPQFFKLNV